MTVVFVIKYIILSILTSNITAYLINNLTLKFIKEQSEFNKKKLIRSILFMIFTIFILALLYQFIDTYSNVPAEQLAFHLQVPLEGTSSSIIWDFIKLPLQIVLIAIICIIIIILIETKILKNKILYLQIKLKNKVKKFKLLPLDFASWKTKAIQIIILICAILFVCSKMDLLSFIQNQFMESEFIENEYINPDDADITFPTEKRNLIYIYLESMESSNSSKEYGGNYDINYIPYLTQIALENTNLSLNNNRFYEITGTNWTIASMVAQTSGLPLKFSVDSDAYNADKNSFLNGITTLGEILEDNGYKNYLYLGSDAAFAYRDTYFSIHGNYNIFDYKKAKEEQYIEEDYYVWWGYEDKKLYEYSKEKLLEISEGDELFNFTLLTADTHATDGYLDPECECLYDTQLENVISCADSMIADFISWIQEQDFYENTTIVIVGDHLYMANDSFYDGNRSIYASIINPAIDTEVNNREFSAVDMFPTTLAALGVEIKENRLGLGINLFSDEKTLIEQYGYNYVNEELKKKSTFYNNISLYN